MRGLTTAASIWITAGIGVMIGVGFYFPAGIATAMTLIVLSVFRWIERTMPIEFYANLTVCFARSGNMPESDLRALIARHGFVVANMNYGVTERERRSSTDRSTRRTATDLRLAEALNALPRSWRFLISPTGD